MCVSVSIECVTRNVRFGANLTKCMSRLPCASQESHIVACVCSNVSPCIVIHILAPESMITHLLIKYMLPHCSPLPTVHERCHREFLIGESHYQITLSWPPLLDWSAVTNARASALQPLPRCLRRSSSLNAGNWHRFAGSELS